MRILPKIFLPSILIVVAIIFPARSLASTVSVSSSGNITSHYKIEIPTTNEDTTTTIPTIVPAQSFAQISIPTPTIVRPTNRPTATPTLRPSATPTPMSATTSDEKKTFIMNAINDYRKLKGLSSVQTSTETCNFAKIRAKEISTGFNHDGFRNRINNKTIPYARWTSITENIAMISNYKNVVNMWINSSGHAANMQKDTPYVCVESYGNYYAYEGMRP